jgi:hypothetical protein
LRTTPTAAEAFCLFALAALFACDRFPKDIAGTTDAVTRGTLHAGLVADASVEPDERSLIDAVSQAAAADADIQTGSAEILLSRLESGDLNLVVGRFSGDSPWKSRVAFTAPAESASPSSDAPVLRAAVRAGENRWLIFVTRTIGAGA